MRAESSIPAPRFQRSKCDCQVYKRLFMFSGVKWGASARSGAGAGADSAASIVPARCIHPAAASILHAAAARAPRPLTGAINHRWEMLYLQLTPLPVTNTQ